MSLVPSGFGGGGGGYSGGAFANPALAPNGSELAPSYAFSSDLSTGFYKSAPGIAAISAGGVRRADFSTAGVNFYTGPLFVADGTQTNPGYAFQGSGSDGMYLIGANRLGLTSGNKTWLEVNTSGVSASMLTVATASGMTIGQLKVVFAASGISLMYSSGKSSYVLGQSTQSALQA